MEKFGEKPKMICDLLQRPKPLPPPITKLPVIRLCELHTEAIVTQLNPLKNRDRLAQEIANDQTLADYLQQLERFPRVSRDEERALTLRVGGDRRARNRLVEVNLRLVVAVAVEYLGRGLPMMDLIQEGSIGLMAATDRFDPSRGLRFSAYAVWWIRKACQDAVIRRGSLIRVPHHVHSQRTRAYREGVALADHILSALAPIVSLDAPFESGATLTLAETLSDGRQTPEEQVVEQEDVEALMERLGLLSALQRTVLCMRYGVCEHEGAGERTLAQIARTLKLKEAQVRTLERDALEHLRTLYSADLEQSA